MEPALFTSARSYDSTACDTITVELHDVAQPFNTLFIAKALLHKNGNVQLIFPSSVLNQSYYIAIRHRNSIETWSKNPVLFNSAATSFDFTSP